ncbi:hypothetical protein H845_1927 [Komagataeibacter xylinus E25]|nr:hypothetical protein H845_1927 [Komagataeibacter xylinus E25]
MHQHDAADLARRLAGQAEAVCRHYLPAGRRQGHYWLVGDARNTPGRSMFVRLQGGEGKAPVKTPRRAMGQLLGHAVRFGVASGVMAMGEGIETVLSISMVLPELPMAACLSSAHLAASAFPALLRRLYVIRDDDPAGDHTAKALCQRAPAVGIEAIVLSPRLADFNDDLRHLGRGALRSVLRPQLAPQDVAPLMDGTV